MDYPRMSKNSRATALSLIFCYRFNSASKLEDLEIYWIIGRLLWLKLFLIWIEQRPYSQKIYTFKFATLINGHTSCLSKDPACKISPKQPDSPLFFIALHKTPRIIFMKNYFSLCSLMLNWTQSSSQNYIVYHDYNLE